MPSACNLTWLTLSAIGCSPDFSVVAVADGVARAPELRGQPSVGVISEHLTELSVPNLVVNLGTGR